MIDPDIFAFGKLGAFLVFREQWLLFCKIQQVASNTTDSVYNRTNELSNLSTKTMLQ